MKPAHTRAGVPGAKSRRAIKGVCGALAVAASIAAAAVLAIQLGSEPAPKAEITTLGAEPRSAGTIVVHSGAERCTRRIFDNQTGRISDAPAPCQQDVVLDPKGNPIPTGTVHTLNSISKSFK